MKASDLFVKCLENEGVEYIFAVPGEEILDLMESIRRSSIELIVLRHEQSVGFMASTYGRLTGKPGVCLVTLGPGATNLVTAAAYAQLGAMPIIMISGQKPIKEHRQGKFQVIDVIEMMRPLTKLTKQIVDGRNIPALIREAFRIAENERPGAVHIELPEDVAKDDCTCPVFEKNTSLRPSPDPVAIKEAVKRIEAAKHPILLIGAGANRKRISTALSKFIQKTKIPFFNTQMGKGVLDERNPLFLGTAALSENDFVHCAVDYADLIINIGHDSVEKPPFFMRHGGREVLHINFTPSEVDDVYFPQLDVVGDIANAIKMLTRSIRYQKSWDLAYYEKVKKMLSSNIKEGITDDRFPIFPPRLVHDVRKVLPPGGIITLDNGMYKIWFARNYHACEPNTILLDNALAAMGAGFSSAMAAKMVYPKKKVVAICGDGGFLMNAHELEPAVRMNLDLVVLVLVDNGYGMIKWKQEAQRLPDFGLDFGNPDFVQYAEAFGAQGHRVTKADELQEKLSLCIKQKGVHLIEVPIDYSSNNYLLGEKLKELTCKIQ